MKNLIANIPLINLNCPQCGTGHEDPITGSYDIELVHVGDRRTCRVCATVAKVPVFVRLKP
jgi:hypothetical protein